MRRAARRRAATIGAKTSRNQRLQWATIQTNLGLALWRLGERESGTVRLEEAVGAYRAALEEFTREHALHYRDETQKNLDAALKLLEERKR